MEWRNILHARKLRDEMRFGVWLYWGWEGLDTVGGEWVGLEVIGTS